MVAGQRWREKGLDFGGPFFYTWAMPKPLQGCEADVLQRVTVRLLHDEERESFDRLLENRHYLASARLVGQTLRHVAQLDLPASGDQAGGQHAPFGDASEAAVHRVHRAAEGEQRFHPRGLVPSCLCRRRA